MIFHTEQRSYKGLTFTIEHHTDDHHGAPWSEEDGHGPVSEWTTRKKAPGERILSSDRHNAKRYYNVAEAMKIAIREQWGPVHCKTCGHEEEAHTADARCTSFLPERRKETAARAVERDFQYLRAWCNDEWYYVGVVVSLTGTTPSASLWGIESTDDSYLKEVEVDLMDQLIEEAPMQLHRAAARLREKADTLETLAAQVEATV